MKKSLIALAVAGALAVPAIASADATLYGTVAIDGVFKNDTSADIEVDDAVIGLKGNVDLGIEGVTGFFNIRTELGAEGAASSGGSTLTTDRALAGITGSFGTIQGGAMGNPVDAVESLDVATNSYSQGNWFVNPDDLQSALAYVSPTVGGFTGYAGIVMDGGLVDRVAPLTNDEDLDGYVLGFNYVVGGLTADVGYWKFDQNGTVAANDDADYYGVSLSYAVNQNWSATMNYAKSEDFVAVADDTTLWAVGTQYKIGNTTLGLNYVDFDAENNGADVTAVSATRNAAGVTTAGTTGSGDEWSVTATHQLGNRAKVYAVFSDASLDGVSVAGERVLNVGYSLSF